MRLAGADLQLVVPPSFTERLDLVEALRTSENGHRPACAALGLCWPRVRRRLPYSGKPLEYGGKVIDLLIGEGASMEEISSAAVQALELVMAAAMPSTAGVEAAVGNSEAPILPS
jgi:hypothetical protein